MNSYHDNHSEKPCCSFDQGPSPFIGSLQQIAKNNNNFRTAFWTGEHLQITLMCIPPHSDIGLENHPHLDQFLYIVQGCGCAMMGCHKECLNYQQKVQEGSSIIVPANTWHNLVNTGCCPIKLISIYAPPQHPFGTVHVTKAEAEASEGY